MKTIFRVLAVSAIAVSALSLSACFSADGALGPVGVWGEPGVAGKPSLEFTSDGKVAGSDGCNRLIGTWELVESGVVTFGEGMASTMMYCEGVDTWLSAATGATIENETLLLTDSTGKQIGSLALVETTN